MGSFIVSLILLMADGSMLVMPLVNLGPKDWHECESIGFSATEYANSLNEGEGIKVRLPDGSVAVAKEAAGWSCSPTEWYEPKEPTDGGEDR